MKLNQVSEPIFTSKDLINEIYKGNLDKINLAKIEYNADIDYLSYVEFISDNNLKDWPLPSPYLGEFRDQQEFDKSIQSIWYMPDKYKNFDIEGFILSLCKNKEELDRVSIELDLFRKHDMINLLRFLKYLVETMKDNKIVWGVGRGSSVASYSLYLLGVHKVNSIKYNLNIKEFLK